MSIDSDRSAGRPLVITGMHRSGTSLLASMLASAGVDVGENLLGPRTGNTLGHFEDVGFLDFHIRALRAAGDNIDGYSARVPADLPPELKAEADELVATRTAAGRLWGWKDPRTTLLLDFWQERLPDARYLFVFRSPWDVADSLFRRGDALFVESPAWTIHAWLAYNRLIADFVTRHPDRCLVVDVAAVVRDPSATFERIRFALGVPLGEPGQCYRHGLFASDRNPLGKSIVAALLPEALDFFAFMQRLAGAPEAAGDGREGLVAIADPGLLVGEWARASRAEALAGRQSAEAEASRGELEQTRKAAEQARTELEQARAELSALRGALNDVTGELSSVAARIGRLEEEAAATEADRRRLEGDILAALAWLPPGSAEVANRIRDLVLEVVERPGRVIPMPGLRGPARSRREAA